MMKKMYLKPLVEVTKVTLHSTICESTPGEKGENDGTEVAVSAPSRLYM